MARIVVITHTYDNFQQRDYLLKQLFKDWLKAGHSLILSAGLEDWPEGDIAILHVDLSRVPEAYTKASQHYPIVLNGKVKDIRRSQWNPNILAPNSQWPGEVIVKSNLNCAGFPELRLQKIAEQTHEKMDLPLDELNDLVSNYPIFKTLTDVPEKSWSNPGLVVEPFRPEQDAQGYWMRAWVFLGDQERCTRYLSSHPIVKSSNIISREPVAVPKALRAERERLGFDFGKFDFALHNGEVVLYDVNRTPFGPPPPMSPEMKASNTSLAMGLESWLKP